MYICSSCGIVTQPREPMRKIVVETRSKIYLDPDDERVVVGRGQEIVREMKMCPACAPKSAAL